MSEWQPIETAPKDETLVLAVNSKGTQRVCWWAHGGWVFYQKYAGPHSELLGVTHWMPLPAPPLATVGAPR